jgi:hypothetical protein
MVARQPGQDKRIAAPDVDAPFREVVRLMAYEGSRE